MYGMTRIIGHLDMDAFFAAVEERDKPWLKGKPIVVGADPQGGHGRGVVSTANYAARKFGIRSALPISAAWRLAESARRKGAPPTVWLTPSGRRYGEVSAKIMAIVRRQVSLVEQVSVDEAYLDLSAAATFEAAAEICRNLKTEIRAKEKLTASVGIGPNKLIAKIASDLEKPDGLTMVTPAEAEKVLAPLAVRVLPGVGPKTEEILNRRGVRKIEDIKKFTREELREMFGKSGVDLYAKARGLDDRLLVAAAEAKSVGEQETFMRDTRDAEILTDKLRELAATVSRRLKADGFTAYRRVVLTVRFADFTTLTRSRTLEEPADSAAVLEFEILKLFLPFLDRRENPRGQALRLIGVRIEKLE